MYRVFSTGLYRNIFFFSKKNELQRLCVLTRTNRWFQCMFWYTLTQCIECVPLDCIGISVTSENKNTHKHKQNVFPHTTQNMFRDQWMCLHTIYFVLHTHPNNSFALDSIWISATFFSKHQPRCFHAHQSVSTQSYVFVHNLMCFTRTHERVLSVGLYRVA